MVDQRLIKIREYEDQIRDLLDTAENKRRANLWIDEHDDSDTIWHPLPKDKDHMPFSFEIERIGYARMIGFSLVKFYTDPIEYVLRSLEIMLFKFNTFPEDCSPIGKAIAYWPGVGFEASLMGLPQQYTEEDSWVGRHPVVSERIPLEKIEYPDFYNSRIMVETHEFFNKMREVMSDDFIVLFPRWNRSPWSVAWAIRGIENLIYDYIEDPEWTAAFVDLLTDYRIRFTQDRAKHLGVAKDKTTNLYNDEVLSPVISPAMYRDIILPSDKRIAVEYGSISYWHSCGNTTPFYEDINTIPNLSMVHIGPWSDVREAVKKYSEDKTLEVALNPLSDVMTPAYPEKIRERLIEIKEITASRLSVCRSDGFMVIHDVETDIRILREWMSLK